MRAAKAPLFAASTEMSNIQCSMSNVQGRILRWLVVEVIRGWEGDGDSTVWPRDSSKVPFPTRKTMGTARFARESILLLQEQPRSGSLYLDIGHWTLDIGHSLAACNRPTNMTELLTGTCLTLSALQMVVAWLDDAFLSPARSPHGYFAWGETPTSNPAKGPESNSSTVFTCVGSTSCGTRTETGQNVPQVKPELPASTTRSCTSERVFAQFGSRAADWPTRLFVK